MKVYCTRPRRPDEAPHWHEIAVDDLFDHAQSAIALDQHCQQCGMPLILKGRYVPIQELGQGGFGRTFLALDREFFDPEKPLVDQSQRVIKQFRSDRLLLPEQMAQAERAFQREKNILNQLSHAAIPRIYSYFKLQVTAERSIDRTFDPSAMITLHPEQSQAIDHPRDSVINSSSRSTDTREFHYLVQEYVQGQDLQKELDDRQQVNTRFTEAEVLVILKQILAVLAYIHTRPEPVIHRDIKPSNIVYSRAKSTYYLIDFGAVRQIIPIVEQGLTRQATHFVTPGFSPPEQYDRQVDFSSDLYALAKTAICLLTGSPFNQPSWPQAAQVSPQLVQVLDRMSHPYPPQRYQSAHAVQQALQALEGSTSKVMPPTVLNLEKRRSRWLGGAIAISLLVILAAWLGARLPVALMSTTGPITAPTPPFDPATPLPDAVFKLPPQPNSISSVSDVPSGEVRYGGSTTWLTLSSNVNPVIGQAFPHLRLQTVAPPPGQWWHSEAGIAMLIAGEVDFALSSKGIPDELKKQAQAKGVKLKKIPIALSSSVIAVHPSLPIVGITVAQVEQIKKGQVTNWKDLGGSDRPITIYTMDKLYLGGAEFKRVRNATEALQQVAADPGGVHIAPSSIAVKQCQVKALAVGFDLTQLVNPYEQPLVSVADCLNGRKNRVNIKVIQNSKYPLTAAELTVVVLDDNGFKQRAGEAYAKMFHTAQGRAFTREAGYLPIDEIQKNSDR